MLSDTHKKIIKRFIEYGKVPEKLGLKVLVKTLRRQWETKKEEDNDEKEEGGGGGESPIHKTSPSIVLK